MGNCLKGCLSDNADGGMSRTRTSASDSQYEILIEGMQGTDGHQDGGELHEAIKIKSNRKSNFFNKFWTKTNVDYARLNKAKHNNFSKRATNAGSNASKHNQHPKSGLDIQLQCLDAHSLLLVSKDGHRKTNANGYNDLQTDQTSTPGSSIDLEWENDYGYQHSQWLSQEDDQTGPSQLHSFPASVQESVFKIEEWSTLKRSKDRINALRKLDHQQPVHQAQSSQLHLTSKNSTGSEDVTGSLDCIHPVQSSRPFPSFEHHAASLTRVDRMTHGESSDLSHISSTPEGSLEWDIDQDRQLKSENESLDYDTKELLLEIEQLKNRVLNETGATLKDDLPSS
ncbi:uncharacterized protein LOC128303915 [Anopheles moucheti]|uniref:uncharacterized protein LOC128303915 n=1 Tax=Anopheles moucheti TaxID=186751 RepID=UPI0022F01A38|nr:uncharacterized protein LOC128303915 [Anopheles moucheti]